MRKAFLQLHLAVLLAGFTGILGRLITLNEGLLVWYRLLISSITLWIILYFSKNLSRISFRDLVKITGVGFIAALHWVTFYGSIKYANVSVALVCFSAIGFFTAIMEPIIIKRKFSLQEILLGLLAIAGIFIIFHFDPKYKTGIIVGIISAFLGAVFPIFNLQLVQKHKPETVTVYELSGGFLSLTLMMPLYLSLFPTPSLIPDKTDWLWLIVLSWLCTVWAFQLLMNALRKISAFTVNLSYNLEPVYGILLAFLVYNENEYLHPAFYLGMGLILLAVALQTVRVYRQRRSSELVREPNK